MEIFSEEPRTGSQRLVWVYFACPFENIFEQRQRAVAANDSACVVADRAVARFIVEIPEKDSFIAAETVEQIFYIIFQTRSLA